jgi:hypothetical protein
MLNAERVLMRDYPEVIVPIDHEVAWTYAFPTHQLLPIAGLIAFYNERVDIRVGGNPSPPTDNAIFSVTRTTADAVRMFARGPDWDTATLRRGSGRSPLLAR